jgi:hypothetical protein
MVKFAKKANVKYVNKYIRPANTYSHSERAAAERDMVDQLTKQGFNASNFSSDRLVEIAALREASALPRGKGSRNLLGAATRRRRNARRRATRKMRR